MILILMNFGHVATVLIGLTSVLTLAACGIPEDAVPGGSASVDDSAIQVAAAFYPLEYASTTVGGDAVNVTPLTIPGVEAHDVELTPRQVAALVEADLVVYLSGFQPAVDEAVKQADPSRVMDVAPYAELLAVDAEGHTAGDVHAEDDHGDVDPHFWLDPLRLASVTDAIAERLATMNPEKAQFFADNAASTRGELTTLDSEFTAGLQNCERHSLFTSHAAFGYLAERYHLIQVSVVGISPNVEPSGARIAEVQQLARDYDATTIFFETTASDAVAKSIAQDLGMTTAVLDPVASLNDQSLDEDYLGIMRANLAAIREANDCG